MKILLLGDYSNVHWTLGQGLRALGHDVCVASDGDNWKDYPRDIDLKRPSMGRLSSMRYYIGLWRQFHRFRGYDVVQLINPVFLPLKAQRIKPFYQFLRRHNKKVFMGAFGMDHYWVRTCLDGTTFRYSDFNLGSQIRHSQENDTWIADWLNGPKGRLNCRVAQDCDGIVSGLYEYHMCYMPHYPEKTQFIPFPIDIRQRQPRVRQSDGSVHFFIGIQRQRNTYKGTDIMLRALERLQSSYPTRVVIEKAESVPFEQYCRMMDNSHVLLDQLYSYTPAMNALMAMAQGLVVVGGGEPEAYDLLGDTDLRPVVNVLPHEESVYDALEQLVLHPERIEDLSRKSIQYIEKFHDHIKVAQEYLDFWNKA